MLLVIIVIIVFLQSWRMAIVPIVAIPVSLIGTLAVLYAAGFSLNMLTLFGLVLAIGIVVDDAIVVVENVERNIAAGLTPQGRRLAPNDGRGRNGGRRDLAGADRSVRADGLHSGHFRSVLPAVCDHHRGVDGDLGVQFADAVAGAGRAAVQAAPSVGGAAALLPGAVRAGACRRLQPRLRQARALLFEHRSRAGRLVDSARSPCSPFSPRSSMPRSTWCRRCRAASFRRSTRAMRSSSCNCRTALRCRGPTRSSSRPPRSSRTRQASTTRSPLPASPARPSPMPAMPA